MYSKFASVYLPCANDPGQALFAYQSCLAECDESTRFYHRSFAVDPIGVARTLLGWRTRWYEAGWSGSFSDGVSKRLRDVSDVEVLAASVCRMACAESGNSAASIAQGFHFSRPLAAEQLQNWIAGYAHMTAAPSLASKGARRAMPQ